MKILKWFFFLLLLAGLPAQLLRAQNTLDGVKKEVPQEELERQSQFLDAEKARMLGQYDQAIELYRKFLYKNETSDAALYGLARCYVEKKGFGTALETIDKALAINPENKWYYLLKADIFERNGQHAFAAEVYEALIKKFPQTPEFYERLAYLSVLAENPKRALKALDQLEALIGVSEMTASKRHLIFVALKDNKKAAAELKKLVNAYPSRLDYRKSLARFYAETGDASSARATWQEILKIDPNDPDARLALLDGASRSDIDRAKALAPLFRDPTVSIDAKIKELTPLLEKLSPAADPAWASALLELGAALETIHKDDPKAWSASGDLYYLLDRNDEALERYTRCIALRPRVFSVWDNALTILADKKDWSGVFVLSEKAMDAFPNQPRGYFWYGSAANALKKPEEALPVLEQALVMSGARMDLYLDITDQIGYALILQKKPEAAIERYEKVWAKGGEKHPGILEHLGDAWALKGDKTKAGQYWQAAKNIRSTPELEQKLIKG